MNNMYSQDNSITIQDITIMLKGLLKKRVMPNFFIIGFPKTGSTSLHYMLHEHPEIQMSTKKETNFLSHNIRKGFNYYSNYWKYEKQVKIYGESSIFYCVYPKVAKVINTYFPKSKILIVIRNPYNLFRSHYSHSMRNKNIHFNISMLESISTECMDIDLENLKKTRWYDLRRYLEFEKIVRNWSKYNSLDVRTITYESIFESSTFDFNTIMKQICIFLDVDTDFFFTRLHFNKNPNETIELPESVKKLIKEITKDDFIVMDNYRNVI